ncbi:UDPGP type 1 family protein [Paenibacillus hemerocallicola]|uniref:UDPGP type 1 family protein n=1 Tax=Paenibacillus hemerocallicola TaxID=1172614 RepID=A0A5C4T3K8_9BACL|nr:UDPGP type 1 family protein [Paenibacillus hemerocallicola]TNJ63664.1 UDPGP type 1 family protein [Paenibacillus hemerocallicola]
MDHLFEKLSERARSYGQEHLLRYYPLLSETSKTKLLDQIGQIDFAAISELARYVDNKPGADKTGSGAISPIQALDADAFGERERERFTEAGWDMLRQGKVGAFVVAGGQGSRLGHEGPKGTFDIGLPSGKSLFQLQAERLLSLSRRAGRTVPWYVMTSPENHRETVRFFESSGYFGYAPDDICFFRQNVLPALDDAGRIVLSAKDEVAMAPSGNGDAFRSAKQSGVLADMRRRGVEWVFYYNVDNALIRIADPLFVGVAAYYNHPIATKVAEKAHPEEKVGILCLRDGRPAVVEYTEVPEKLMYETDVNGRLAYGLGNLSIHLFRTDFMEAHADADIAYHAAHKKIKTVNEAGETVTPERPNAYKFERFIFDFFPLIDRMTVLNIRRDDEFAPVKNKEGEDSPETARRLLFNLHRKWLERAGVSPERLKDRDIEISPLVSADGEGLTLEACESLLD